MAGHDVQGTVAAGFEPVREEFAAILATEGPTWTRRWRPTTRAS
jgi:hypothetical protein